MPLSELAKPKSSQNIPNKAVLFFVEKFSLFILLLLPNINNIKEEKNIEKEEKNIEKEEKNIEKEKKFSFLMLSNGYVFYDGIHSFNPFIGEIKNLLKEKKITEEEIKLFLREYFIKDYLKYESEKEGFYNFIELKFKDQFKNLGDNEKQQFIKDNFDEIIEKLYNDYFKI